MISIFSITFLLLKKGATGIAQCAELCWQLRGLADKRQVNNVKYCLSHNIGLGEFLSKLYQQNFNLFSFFV